MPSIVTNSAALAAVRTLSDLSGQMLKAEARINTGLKVNQSSDDPGVFSISQSMRATMAGLTSVQDGLSFAHAVVSTGSAAMTQIAAELTKLKQVVTEGQVTGMTSTDINAQITMTLSNIDTYANSAVFNGINLCNANAPAALQFLTDVSGSTAQVGGTNCTSGGLGLTGLQANSGSIDMTLTAGTHFLTNDKLTINQGGGFTKIFELTDGSGPLLCTATSSTSVTAVVFSATDSGSQILAKLSTAMTSQGVSNTLSGTGLMTLNGLSFLVQGLWNNAGGAGIAPLIKTSTPIATAAITAVDAAIATMNARMSSLGSSTKLIEGQQSFSKSLMGSLTEGLGALVDADMAEQSAQLQSLQTRNQLALQTLSIANQQPQSLMSLFR